MLNTNENMLSTRPSHEGRRVLVTGAARGIGRAIALGFAERGATVGICDLAQSNIDAVVEEIREQGIGNAIAIPADVANFEELNTAIISSGGDFDTVINNAGISPKHSGVASKVWEMDPDEWRRVVDVNLTGTFNVIRAVTPAMIRTRRGWIVNTSSVAGQTYMALVGCHYAATKASIIGFTMHLAGELGPYGIRVNALAPGRIETPMVRGVAPEVNAEQVRQTPLGRLGRPEEVADTALWLTSSESSFITGQTIDVAGGLLMT